MKTIRYDVITEHRLCFTSWDKEGCIVNKNSLHSIDQISIYGQPRKLEWRFVTNDVNMSLFGQYRMCYVVF